MMTVPWRLILSPPAAGDWNMAVDELLLELAAAGAGPTLRLYSWDRATLSLGYFQGLDDVPAGDLQSHAVVRRMTGGGAILHDQEVTYATAVPPGMMAGGKLYRRVNGAIVAGLAELGVEARERGRSPSPPRRGSGPAIEGEGYGGERAGGGPFLCFARASATDIIAGSRKLAGSAQRRRRGAVLQQGSILLESVDTRATGVWDVLGGGGKAERRVGNDVVAAAVVRGFEAEFSARFERRDLTRAEQLRAEEIRGLRYANRNWLKSRRRKERT